MTYLKKLGVGTEIYASEKGYEYIKEYHEELTGYCFTSKIKIVDDGLPFVRGEDESAVVYDCMFVNDPNKTIIELDDQELSLVPLTFFGTNNNLIAMQNIEIYESPDVLSSSGKLNADQLATLISYE